jgi:hypothetical protein
MSKKISFDGVVLEVLRLLPKQKAVLKVEELLSSIPVFKRWDRYDFEDNVKMPRLHWSELKGKK